MATSYPKRLIEVDLPIKRISAHARREKSTRHGHISTLHIWWARRPLAACRAVICAALWPDPADPLCPEAFREVARTQMLQWAAAYGRLLSPESFRRFNGLQKEPNRLSDPLELRYALLDFIADFANWDNSASKEFQVTSRTLTQAAHEALGGESGTKPLVVDPFAGGGAIPLEALRVGADAFASDLNPVAVLLNRVVLEYIPKYGKQLTDEVRRWGQWINDQAERELTQFYPKDPDGSSPIAYLWARTIRCEGPGCGAEIPLLRSLWLVQKAKKSKALRIVPNMQDKTIDFEIIQNATSQTVGEGTVRKGSATCPICHYTTPVESLRRQLRERHGGTNDARLICVVMGQQDTEERYYRLPTDNDRFAIKQAETELDRRAREQNGPFSLIPNEPLPVEGALGFRVQRYGIKHWGDLFTNRQVLALTTLARLVKEAGSQIGLENAPLAEAVQVCLAMTVDKQADYLSSLCTWHYHNREKVNHTFSRQALPFVSDFVETVFFGSGSGSWNGLLDWTIMALNETSTITNIGYVEQASASLQPLPDVTAQAVVTDPPYYDAVPYADLSDFFYVWLKRTLPATSGVDLQEELTPKDQECIVDTVRGKDKIFFENTMTQAMSECRRILVPGGICTLVFAHKSTSGWEAQLQAMVSAGWVISGSWPIDTEMGTRLRAHDSAALASSIRLACRPREEISAYEIGDWRDILAELPLRIKEWMPRLIAESIVGADAIFACIGPAIEIFSRYSRVEKASGEQVSLREYLEYVWAAVAREALSMIFEGADATGFDEDARITALWLWTLFSGANEVVEPSDEEDGEEDEETLTSKAPLTGGYLLEYDAARKIAQGLGAHLERLTTVVEVKGEKARLLPVGERARYLFGKEATKPVTTKRKKNVVQAALPGWSTPPVQGEFGWGTSQTAETDEAALVDPSTPKAGETVLDRLHQSMLLFSAGRTQALKRFLVEDGIGQDQRFWRLAQALSALYPMGSDEKRWVDGVLARKKGWGL